MKLVRNLAAALVLACALSVNVYAGDQQTPGYVPPPPSSSECTSDKSATTPQDDGKDTTSTQPTSSDELLLEAVLALLSLF